MRATIIAALIWTGFVCRADLAHGGVVIARDGKSYVGKVQFAAGSQVTVTPAGGDAVTLPFANVTRLSMADEPATQPSAARGDAISVPPPWRHADVGTVKAAGNVVTNADGFVLSGAGWGIWGPSDSCHLLYQPLAGDGEIVARLVDLPTDQNSFQAGLTIRSGLDPDAAQAAVMFSPDGLPHVSCRPVDGHGRHAPPAGVQPHHWLRLIRARDVFSAFCSADGQNWLPVGTRHVKMNESAYAALACAATANQGLAQATFDHVSVRAEPMGPVEGLGLVDGSLIAGHTNRLDAKTLTYVDPAGTERSIPVEKVAYFFTRPLPEETRSKAMEGKPSIFLADGDIMEVQVKGVNERRVAAVSLLFGPQDLELGRVVMVVLRPAVPAGGFSIYARDGSVYKCSTLAVDNGSATANSPLMGAIDLKAADIVAIIADAVRS